VLTVRHEQALAQGAVGTSLIFLVLLGAPPPRAGGASVAPRVIRVTFWGALALK